MPLTVEDLKKRIVSCSLMSFDRLNELETKAGQDSQSSDTFATWMVDQKELTTFQATSLLKGNTKGLVLGDCIVIDKLGEGAMGVVGLARHRTMKRRVAVKILRSSLVNSQTAVQRFYREVKAVAHLEHPNIVRAYDAGEDAGIHYLVMEYVRGKTLSQVLKDTGPLSIDECLTCIIQVAKGLAYAHRRGVIHRDIKPSNLLYGNDGTIKILDMGLARLNDQLGGEIDQEAADLTKTGQIMGTVDFMSPEQAFDSRSVDERSDIYSLGCTLYTLLADQPIFLGSTVMQKLLAHREAAAPSLSRVRMEVPPTLDHVFQKMVAKRPIDRYCTMSQVIADLERIQAGEDVELAPTVVKPSLQDRLSATRDKLPSPSNLWLAVAGGAIVIVLAVLAAILLSSGGPDNELVFKEPPPGETRKDTTPPKTEKKDSQPDKKDGKVQQPVKRNGNKGKNGKKDDTKKDDGKVTPPKSVDNGNKEPITPKGTDDQTGNNTKNGTGTKNGSGERPIVVKSPIRTNGFEPIQPTEVTSLSGGTEFTFAENNCVFARGNDADDTYTIEAKTDVPDITAIRIEALPHIVLPERGPGLDKDGGFSIYEVRVIAVPARNPAAAIEVSESASQREHPSWPRNPSAKCEAPVSGVKSEEAPHVINHLIDGVKGTFWPVRRPGKSTTLTMFLKTPIRHEGGTLLYVQLAQRDKLGHFRVSVSNAPSLASRKTRIEATLPLFVNLGGMTKKDEGGRIWQASREFDGGEFGHIGGSPEGTDQNAPFDSCISGLEEFRVTLPDGKYNVTLLFSGRCPKDVGKRSFFVRGHGLDKQQVKDIPKYQTRVNGAVTFGLKNVEAKDGGLTIQFESEKGEPILNGIAIEKAK